MTTTKLATATADAITIRGKSLCDDLIGRTSFTRMIYFHVLGRTPTDAQVAAVDACLVALVEHGLTPSAVAARLTYGGAPEAMQGAIAAGLLGVGSVFVGTVEGCAALLDRIVRAPDTAAACDELVEDARGPLPGFGHPVHVPDDPRTPALLAVARAHGVYGARCAALEALGRALDAHKGRHVTINATGAVAAVLGDAGVPSEILRGFALIARCVGLVAHVHEEQRDPAFRALWHAAERAIPYAPEGHEP